MRSDYCHVGGEPCQSMCAEPCAWRNKPKGAPTLEDFCNAANDLYAAPTEDRFYAVVNLARDLLQQGSMRWDDGYKFGRGEHAVLLGLLTDCAAVLRTIAPDDSDESEMMADLLGAIDRAIEPDRHKGALL